MSLKGSMVSWTETIFFFSVCTLHILFCLYTTHILYAHYTYNIGNYTKFPWVSRGNSINNTKNKQLKNLEDPKFI